MEGLGPEPAALIGPFPLGDRQASTISRQDVIETLRSAPVLYAVGDEELGRRIVRIAADVCVKYGSEVHISEARTMDLVQRQTSVAIPRVYDYWEECLQVNGSTSITFIVMQFIAGVPLSDVLESMTPKHLSLLCYQLEQIIKQLRMIRLDRPGPVGGGPSTGPLFTEYGAGPFTSSHDLVAWFNGRLAVLHHFGMTTGFTKFNQDMEELVMCHMDIHAHNLILDKNCKIWLIDWGSAGFYPLYFEVHVMKLRPDMQPFLPVIERLESTGDCEKSRRLAAIQYALTTGALITIGSA